MTYVLEQSVDIGPGVSVFYIHETADGLELRTIAFNEGGSQRAELLSRRFGSREEGVAFCAAHPSATTPIFAVTFVRADGGVSARTYRVG